MTTALKFLRLGRVAPFTAVCWPEVGRWLESSGDPELGTSGIHALRASALPVWLAEELWCVELQDVHEAGSGLVVARRGRLLERVDLWNDETAQDFADACLAALPQRATDPVVRGRVADAVDAAREVAAGPSAASMAYIAAKAAEADRPQGYWAERARQSAWLERRLDL